MSVDTPPIYNTTYNSQFFPDSATGLNRAQANALYLQKTVADNATASETFSGGLLTDSIQSITGTASLYTSATSLAVGTNAITTTTVNGSLLTSNATNLAIADNSTNVPSTNWVQNYWAFVKTQTNTWTQVNTFSNSILCPIVNYSGVMNIGNSASTLNIGTQTNRTAGIHIGDGNTNTTGVVHIANGTSNNVTNAVRIMDGTGSSGGIIIGGAGTTTTLNGTVNIVSQANTNPIGLGSLATTSSQLGGSVSMISNGVTSLAATTTTNLYTFTLPAGLWVVYGQATSATVASASYILLSFTSTSATVNVNLQNQVMTSTTLTLANSIMCPIYNSTSTTWYLVGRAGVITTISNLNCLAYRIG